MVSQVTIIGILMIVNGSLQTLMGILYAFLGPLLFSMFSRQAAVPPPQAQQFEQIFTWMSIVYVVLGSVVAIAGIMNIAGGISALRFRSRPFVITALFFNIAPLITCYCLPTSLGLMIWGLIVMFQSDVAHAFTLGGSGYSADEIKQRMGVGGVYHRDRDRDAWDDRGRDRDRPAPKGPPDDEHIYPKDASPPAKSESEPPPPRPGPDQERFFEK
jgi:hypothetical protein